MSLQVKVLAVLCLNISVIVQQSIYVYIPLNRLDKTVTAYYSTCYHKAWTICLVLFKELFDAIRRLFLKVCCSFERKKFIVHQIIYVDYLLKNYDASFQRHHFKNKTQGEYCVGYWDSVAVLFWASLALRLTSAALRTVRVVIFLLFYYLHVPTYLGFKLGSALVFCRG